MNTIITDLSLFTYDDYLKKFDFWVNDASTSSADPSPALVAYTKLNFIRTKRITKTIILCSELKEATEKINHHYTWLVLTEAWCGDGAQNLPVLAAIAKLNPEKIKLHILLRDENPEMMDNYLTNGTRAIPKLIAVDDTLGKQAFVWGPRPLPAQKLLQEWKKDPEGKSWDEFEKDLHGWYAKDKTQTIQRELLQLMKQLT